MKSKLSFDKETDLCAEFMKRIPPEWTVYPETGGFDIVLLRKEDGFQIGIEAKLKLNGKVISQAAEHAGSWYSCKSGPDCRAVLVPYNVSGDLAGVCHLLGIQVIRVLHPDEDQYWHKNRFHPELPEQDHYGWGSDEWFEFFPEKRLTLPDYVPDTIAGDKCPITLTHWKIAAIKLDILMRKTGYITRKDFKELKVSISRWIQGGLSAWLRPDKIKGQFIRGERFPNFSVQHPVNYKQIEADFDVWNPRNEKILK